MGLYFKAEALKIKHTFASKLAIMSPIFAMLISIFFAPMYFQLDCYNWLYAMILPGMLSLGCTLVANKDLKMKNRAVLSLPVDLKKVWISKVLVCSTILAVACIILFLGSSLIEAVLGLNKMGRIPFLNALIGCEVLVVTFLWQIPLCLFLGNKIGMFPTILINIVAYMIFGVLCAPKSVLWLIPYAIPARLMVPIIGVLPNGLPAVQGAPTFTPQVLSNSVILPGILITIALFIILTIVTAKWYEGQEAK